MIIEHELNSLDLDSESVEIQDLKAEDLLDFARYGEYEALQAIMTSEYTSLLTLCDENKVSLLHMVSANGHLECAELLLKCPQVHKTLLNSVNAEGNTPLHWAALNCHIPIIRLLLENGADITIKNSVDRTPFDEAAVAEKYEVTKLIIEFLEKSQSQKQTQNSSDITEEDEDE